MTYKFVFCDEEDRPCIEYSGKTQFFVGDKVYLLGSDGSRDGGPYIIASIPSMQKCTLSFENGQTAKNGEEIEMAKLELA
ncbi:hypothetical protein CJF31_00010053 [Rutstroemia sp. NJR-2017a BVV2]|nr:hypothetical protein CJF31_00010053 [Rutstroemia sp. NJR-2017a BVV2]